MIPLEACEPFFEYAGRYFELEPDTRQLIASHISKITFPPKHIIYAEGDISDKVFFVISGTARSYYTDFSGTTITWSFHFNNKLSIGRNVFAVDYSSFLTNKPSLIKIETLSEASFLVFTKKEMSYMMETSLQYEILMRKFGEFAYVNMYDRALTLLIMSATERYHKLLKEEPHLLQMFSNDNIASYLGIAPQSLSRIKAQRPA